MIPDQELVRAWIQNCRDAIAHGSRSEIADRTFWAYVELEKLCSADPKAALRLILAILASGPEVRVLENLAAGPLEDLLRRNGERILAEVQVAAASSPAFRELIGGVWTNNMPAAVQEAVARLADGAAR